MYKIALDNKWKLMLPNPNMIHRSYTSAQEQYYGYYSHQAQLFDLENDPEEQINLAEKHPEIVTKMSRQINEWWQPIH